MAASDFQNRWAKKTTQPVEAAPAPAADAPVEHPANPAPKEPQPLPTLEDVAKLSADSDYSAFVAKGVDENVKRSAMKKLFSDPHFNIMDRLDIYIDDYTNPAPIPPEMLAQLEHAKALLNPLKHLESPPMRMISRDDVPLEDQNDGATGDMTALDETDDDAIEENEANPSSDMAVDENTDADAEESAKDPVAGASKPEVADSEDTDEPDPGTVANRTDPARQHEHPTGADARPDAKS